MDGTATIRQASARAADPVTLQVVNQRLQSIADEMQTVLCRSAFSSIIKEAQDAGLEVMHEENLRHHYALTLAGWGRNLVENWDECVAEVGEGTARVWGLYMAGSRLAFERNEIQLHQVLAVRTTDDGRDGFPLRPTW